MGRRTILARLVVVGGLSAFLTACGGPAEEKPAPTPEPVFEACELWESPGLPQARVTTSAPEGGRALERRQVFQEHIVGGQMASDFAGDPRDPYMCFLPIDLDKDGDLDVLIQADYTTLWLESNGCPQPSFALRALARSGDSGNRWLGAVDLDNDGDTDILSSGGIWLENDGADAPSFTAYRVPSPPRTEGIYLRGAEDVDSDGDIDIVSVVEYLKPDAHGDFTHEYSTVWLENDGKSPPSFAVRPRQDSGDTSSMPHMALLFANDPPSYGDYPTLHPADLDNDGDTDQVVTLASTPTLTWYENPGVKGATYTPHPIPFKHLHAHPNLAQGEFYARPAPTAFLEDMNRDGHVDIVSTYHWRTPLSERVGTNSAHIVWYANDGGSPPAFALHEIACERGTDIAVQLVDIDEDGDADILSNTLRCYKNDGAATPGFTPELLISPLRGVSSLQTADMDSDGDLDVLAASEDGRIGWHENSGLIPPTFYDHTVVSSDDPAPQEPETPPRPYTRPTRFAEGAKWVGAADLDKDGDLDMLSASEDGTKLAWYESDGAPSPSFAPHIIPCSATYVTAAHCVDLDRDGAPDLVAGFRKRDNLLVWMRNDGNIPLAFDEHVLAQALAYVQTIYSDDLDHDGDPDLLSLGTGQAAWHENDGATPPRFATHMVGISQEAIRCMHAADLDGDGDRDLVAASPGALAWHENTGRPAMSYSMHAIDSPAGGPRALGTGDIDGDGHLDVLLTHSEDRRICWYQNDGASPPGFTLQLIPVSAPPRSDAPPYILETVDIDGNGRWDILIALPDYHGRLDRIVLLRNLGNEQSY